MSKTDFKIKTLDELMMIRERFKKKRKKLVQCDGVFDLVRFGHIGSFEYAQEQGDGVYVVIVGDKFVRKGQGRPLFTENIRARWLASLEAVDYVLINQAEGPREVIKRIQPDILVKGEGYITKPTDGFLLDKSLVEFYGGRVCFAPEPIHSTDIIQKIYSL
jgi:rfaE bifunctional protein nucleotidyltransferase chain/domain